MRTAGVLITVLAVLGAAGLSGCARPGSVGVSGGGGASVGGPFAPASMRIYPLTHLERGEDGEARLILHLEMRDRWGDTVKGVGRLQVQLLRGGELGDGGGGDERMWAIDMRDPETNALYFDPATRTYRVQLRDLPAWAEATVDGAGTPVRLLAVFTTPGGDGSTRYLRDEHTLGG